MDSGENYTTFSSGINLIWVDISGNFLERKGKKKKNYIPRNNVIDFKFKFKRYLLLNLKDIYK